MTKSYSVGVMHSSAPRVTHFSSLIFEMEWISIVCNQSKRLNLFPSRPSSTIRCNYALSNEESGLCVGGMTASCECSTDIQGRFLRS